MLIFRNTVFVVVLGLSVFIACPAQANNKNTFNAPGSSKTAQQSIKSSPAYAELLLRKTELEAELEDLLVAYTEEFPKVKEIRYELNLIQRDLTKLLSQPAADAAKMTLALGKLIVRRAELEADAWGLRTKFSEEHSEVKRVRRRLAIFEKAIAEILP